MRLKKAGNPQESYNMNQKQKNSSGIGTMVGIAFFSSTTTDGLECPRWT